MRLFPSGCTPPKELFTPLQTLQRRASTGVLAKLAQHVTPSTPRGALLEPRAHLPATFGACGCFVRTAAVGDSPLGSCPGSTAFGTSAGLRRTTQGTPKCPERAAKLLSWCYQSSPSLQRLLAMGNKDIQSRSEENKRLIRKAKPTVTSPDAAGRARPGPT